MEFRHCFQSEWEKNTRFGAHGFVPNKRFMREGLQIHWLLKPSIWTVLGQFPFLFICFGTNSQRVSDYLKSWFGLRIADIAAVSTPIYWNSQQRSPFLGLPQLCRAFFSCELMPLWRCVRIWAVGFCNQDISRGKSENWHTINKNGNLRKGNIYFQTKLVGGNSFTYSQYLYSNRRNGMRNHQYFRAYIFQAMDCFKENLKTAISSNIQQSLSPFFWRFRAELPLNRDWDSMTLADFRADSTTSRTSRLRISKDCKGTLPRPSNFRVPWLRRTWIEWWRQNETFQVNGRFMVV